MRLMTDQDIERAINNVRATLKVEGLNMNRRAIVYGRKYLRGELSSEQAINNITEYILAKAGRKNE